MENMSAILNEAVKANDVPFVVAMFGNSDGVLWSGAAGERAPGAPAAEDTVFRIFSMTKAVGSTAAMILVDRGRLDPDALVEDILPEFGDLQVLVGFDGDQPKFRPPKTKATVRHLATHTSGLVYEFWNGDIAKYLEVADHPTIVSGTMKSLGYPMVFDPGERWDYGIGIDWLGQVVEKIDGRRIDQFCREEIFQPLGMTSTDFELTGTMADRLAVLKARGEDGRFADFELSPPSEPEFYGMGHALYSTAPDYMRFVRMFLNKGQLDGRRILSEKAVEMMLANHIGALDVVEMKTVAPAVTADAEFFPGLKKKHGLGFMSLEEDAPGMRSAGSQCWAGVCNTHFWFDPTRDVAGVLMTQTLPFVEPPFMKLYDRFERAVYANLD